MRDADERSDMTVGANAFPGRPGRLIMRTLPVARAAENSSLVSATDGESGLSHMTDLCAASSARTIPALPSDGPQKYTILTSEESTWEKSLEPMTRIRSRCISPIWSFAACGRSGESTFQARAIASMRSKLRAVTFMRSALSSTMKVTKQPAVRARLRAPVLRAGRQRHAEVRR